MEGFTKFRSFTFLIFELSYSYSVSSPWNTQASLFLVSIQTRLKKCNLSLCFMTILTKIYFWVEHENSLESLINLLNCFSTTFEKVLDLLGLWLVDIVPCITTLIFPFRFQGPPPPNNTGPSYPLYSHQSQPAYPNTASTSSTTQLANQLNSMQINSYGNHFYVVCLFDFFLS